MIERLYESRESLRGVLIAALLALPLFAGCSGSEPATEHLNRATDVIVAGKLREGVIELKNALAKDPNLLEGRFLLAKVALDLGDTRSARKEIDRAEELGLSAAQVQPIKAGALFLAGDYENVVKTLEPLATGLTGHEQADLLSLRARAQLRFVDSAAARQSLDAALALGVESAAVLLAEAEYELLQRQIEDAEEALQRAVQLAPDYADAWSLIGDLATVSGDQLKAEAAYAKAASLRHYVSQDLAKLSLVRVQLDKFDEAGKDLGRLKAAGMASHPFVHYVDGVLHFKQSRYGEAAAAFEACITASPDFPNAMIYMATTQLAMGNLEQARAWADRARRSLPNSTSASRVLGAVLVNQGDLDAAKDVVLNALGRSPRDPVLLQMAGAVILQAGDAEASIPFLERWQEVEPASDYVKETLFRAKFLAGKVSDSDFQLELEPQGQTTREFPTRELMAAVNDMRNGDLREALAKAEELRSRYPDNVDPVNLIAAIRFAAGQWDLGKKELEKVLLLKPGDPTAARNLAAVLDREGQPGEALELLSPVVEAYPRNEPAVLLLASIQARMLDSAASVRTLEQGLRDIPESLQLRSRLMASYFDARRYGDVLDLSDTLTSEQLTANPLMLELRGKAQMMTGDIVAARRSFDVLVGALPESAGARYLLADTLARAGELNAAQRELAEVLRRAPGYLSARMLDVRLMVARGEVGAAAKALELLSSEYSGHPDVMKLEGWFSLGTGQFVQAERALANYLETKPDAEAALLLVKAMWGQGQSEAAIGFMSQWLDENPQDLAMRFYLAGAFLSLDRHDEAVNAYLDIVGQYPSHAPSLNNLAWLTRDQDASKALAYAERALSLEPSNPQIMDTLAMLLIRGGERARGLQLLREAVRAGPDDPGIHMHLGRALIDSGRLDEAREVLDALTRRSPDSATAGEARELLDSIAGR